KASPLSNICSLERSCRHSRTTMHVAPADPETIPLPTHTSFLRHVPDAVRVRQRNARQSLRTFRLRSLEVFRELSIEFPRSLTWNSQEDFGLRSTASFRCWVVSSVTLKPGPKSWLVSAGGR